MIWLAALAVGVGLLAVLTLAWLAALTRIVLGLTRRVAWLYGRLDEEQVASIYEEGGPP